MLRIGRTLPIWLVFSQILLVTGAARAEDPAAAEALFQEGRRLLSDGKVTAACEKLKESFALDPMSGTLLNLADCYEKDGRTATAWARFRNAASLARSQGKTEQVAEANRRIKALEADLSYLKIEVPDPVPGLEVRRGDLEVSPAAFGVEVPVDPGRVTVIASAPGYKRVRIRVEVGAQRDKQTVTVPKLAERGETEALEDEDIDDEPDEVATTAVKKEEADASDGAKAPVEAPTAGVALTPAAPSGGPGAVTWIVGGVGTAFLLTGGIFGYLAVQSDTDAANLCPTKYSCSKAAMAVVDRRDQQAMVSNIGVGLGLAGIATATVLYFVGKSKSEHVQSAALTLQPAIGRNDAGLWATGKF